MCTGTGIEHCALVHIMAIAVIEYCVLVQLLNIVHWYTSWQLLSLNIVHWYTSWQSLSLNIVHWYREKVMARGVIRSTLVELLVSPSLHTVSLRCDFVERAV